VIAVAVLILLRPRRPKTPPARLGTAQPAELRYTDYLTNFRGPGKPLDWEEWYARND
jgi:hypothetical protein